jgi:hypothetical protein
MQEDCDDMTSALAFPTALHEDVAQTVVGFFKGRVDAVLVIASCARGMAVSASDLDMVVLVVPENRDALEHEWTAFRTSSDAVGRLTLHLDLIDGIYQPAKWDDGGGPDDFELEIGNHVAYSAPLWVGGPRFEKLKARWLPYYEESLRNERLEMVRNACLLDLDFIASYVERELYFQAFDRLYKAFREFLQALFISRRLYPVAYNKWIRNQVCDLLGTPELYPELPRVLEVRRLEGNGLLTNRDHLKDLAMAWLS